MASNGSLNSFAGWIVLSRSIEDDPKGSNLHPKALTMNRLMEIHPNCYARLVEPCGEIDTSLVPEHRHRAFLMDNQLLFRKNRNRVLHLSHS